MLIRILSDKDINDLLEKLNNQHLVLFPLISDERGFMDLYLSLIDHNLVIEISINYQRYEATLPLFDGCTITTRNYLWDAHEPFKCMKRGLEATIRLAKKILIDEQHKE